MSYFRCFQARILYEMFVFGRIYDHQRIDRIQNVFENLPHIMGDPEKL